MGIFYNLDIGVGLRIGICLSCCVVFVVGVCMGVGMLGLISFMDSLGGFVVVLVGIDVVAFLGFLIGLSVVFIFIMVFDVSGCLVGSVGFLILI